MREILFRGKRVDNGEWVEGDLQQSPISLPEIYNHTKDGGCYRGNTYQVDPATIGQYTNAMDDGKKMIFSGDILDNAYIVYWAKLSLKWMCKPIKKAPNGAYWNLGDLAWQAEITGNIFDKETK